MKRKQLLFLLVLLVTAATGAWAQDNPDTDKETVLTNVVTQSNFNDFFDDEGKLLDAITFDELIFQGEFTDTDLGLSFITLDRPITITGDEAVLYNIGFKIKETDNVVLDNLILVADTPLGALIDVDDSFDVNLTNLDITYDGGDKGAVAINVTGDNVNILNNTISFESHVPDDTEFAVGLKLTDCSNAVVDGNKITTKLPCVYVVTYDDDYYMMGADRVNPVRLKDCTDLSFTNNVINSTTNDYSADFPTIQAIQIIGCHDSVLDHNSISMIDEMTPAGMDNYLYGINFGYNKKVTFSNNNFKMSTKGGKDGAGAAYAFQGVESEVNIIGNSITSISNGPNLGIYVASMYGGDSDLIIEDNFIEVTGFASSSGSWALVSGIEIQNGDAKIHNNKIYTYNVNDYDEGNYMYGISYAQWMYGDRSFDIQDNTVYTEGKYAISVIDATSLNVANNTLYAHELKGDNSVDSGDCQDVTIEDNKDNLPLNNIVTQSNFDKFFDENGSLLDNVTFDELIFKGDFADLVPYITIDRPITITGDHNEDTGEHYAVLNDMGFIIAGSEVTLDNLTLVANSDLGNLIDIACENAVISKCNITYVVSDPASAINVYSGANGVQILGNTIYFESTVDDYTMDDVTAAICVNSGISVFDEEDPIEGLVIDDNKITAVIPAFLADAYENEYYVMGLSAVNGVRINGAEDFEFTNNILDVTTNRLDRTTPTLQAMYVASSSGLIDGNDISMIDEFTPASKDVYLYAVELIYDDKLTISNNNFNISTEGGKEEQGTACAIVAIQSDFDVADNNITTVSKGPNYAVYFPSNMGSPCDAIISGNFINVTGLATAAHNYGLVSGIEIETGNVEISGNTIYTYNIGEYAEGNYIYGISYAWDGVTPEVEITDNTIITEGRYAISFLKVDDAVITDNTLCAHELTGDDAVYIAEGSGNTVKNNHGLLFTAKKPTDDPQENYWTTFYCGGVGLTFDATDACAYTATVSGTTITLHKLGQVIPKGTAIIIVSKDENINLKSSTADAEYTVDNDLHGVDMATALSDVKKNLDADAILMLTNKGGNFGFHELATTNVPARKAFLPIDDLSGAREFTMVFEDATGIQSIDHSPLTIDHYDDAWYSLDGRRLSGKPTKSGVYMNSGRKVVIK